MVHLAAIAVSLGNSINNNIMNADKQISLYDGSRAKIQIYLHKTRIRRNKDKKKRTRQTYLLPEDIVTETGLKVL